jgi:hypothetical protein
MRELTERVRQMVEASRTVGAPSARARERLSRALGRRLAVGAVVAAATLGSREVAGASVGTATTTLAGVATVKWLLVSVFVMVGGLGGFGAYRWGAAAHGWLGGPRGPNQAVSAAPMAAVPSAPRLEPKPSAEPLPVPVNSVALPLNAPPTVSVPPSRVSRSVTNGAGKAGDLGRELELLRGAQRALDSGAHLQALGLLDQYSREFPRGSLRYEYSAVRVLALCAAGQRTSALRARQQFLEKEPNSALAHRVRKACGAVEPTPATASHQE